MQTGFQQEDCEAPYVIVYSEDAIIEQPVPAHACSPIPCPVCS